MDVIVVLDSLIVAFLDFVQKSGKDLRIDLRQGVKKVHLVHDVHSHHLQCIWTTNNFEARMHVEFNLSDIF